MAERPRRPRTPASVTILGKGYTGSALASLLEARGITVVATRRSPSGSGILAFDLEDPATWTTLPASDATVWTFPAEPPDRVGRILHERSADLGSIVAIGTTSSYLHPGDAEEVSESSGTDHGQERVRGEELLLEHGAVVLRSAGIYGPSLGGYRARNPLDWLRSGRIASPENWVNLIHVEDLAECICAALASGVAGEDFIVSDGTPRRWGEIERWARERGYVGDVSYTGRGRLSRRLSNRKLIETLRPAMRHADLFAELPFLENSR